MDYASATIPELEDEVNRIEGEIKKMRLQQFDAHDAAELKRRRLPILATDKYIMLDPLAVGDEESMLKWMAMQPKKLLDFIKSKHKDGE